VLSRGRPSQTVTLPDPSTVTPELDSDGLVRSRPGTWQVDHDTPVLGSYYEVALFDPVELADGGEEVPGTAIDDVRAVEHHGRPAWEAIVHPTGAYAPSRCSCCALLTSDAVDGEDPDTAEVDLAFVYPDAHRVRLDVGTGICVEVARLTGSRAGRGHVLRTRHHLAVTDDACGAARAVRGRTSDVAPSSTGHQLVVPVSPLASTVAVVRGRVSRVRSPGQRAAPVAARASCHPDQDRRPRRAPPGHTALTAPLLPTAAAARFASRSSRARGGHTLGGRRRPSAPPNRTAHPRGAARPEECTCAATN
jgi:hypothetical protein